MERLSASARGAYGARPIPGAGENGVTGAAGCKRKRERHTKFSAEQFLRDAIVVNDSGSLPPRFQDWGS